MIPSGLVHAVDGTGLPGSGAGSPITRRDAEGGGDGLGERHVQGGPHRDVLWENRTDSVKCLGRPVGEAPAMAEFHLVESASALHYGLEIEDEENGEVRRGDSLLIRLGTNEGGTAEDLPLPEDAPARGAASACWTSGRRFRGRCEPTSTPRKAMSSASMNPGLPRDSVVGQCRARVEMTGCGTWRTRDGRPPACAGLRRPAAGPRVSERPGCGPFRGRPRRRPWVLDNARLSGQANSLRWACPAKWGKSCRERKARRIVAVQDDGAPTCRRECR